MINWKIINKKLDWFSYGVGASLPLFPAAVALVLLLPASIAVEWLGAPDELYAPSKVLGGLALGLWIINLAVLCPLQMLTNELAESQMTRERESRDPSSEGGKASRYQAFFFDEEFWIRRVITAFLCGIALSAADESRTAFVLPLRILFQFWPIFLVGLGIFVIGHSSPRHAAEKVFSILFRSFGYFMVLVWGGGIGAYLFH